MIQGAFEFLPFKDSLTRTINEKANTLFHLLKNFDATSLQIEEEYKTYFINHHLGRRLFFSVENSAHIIYHSVKKSGKTIDQLNVVDFGAGLGTLYMLGGMLDFKRFFYNDHLPVWQDTAKKICNALNITLTNFITGDIDAVTNYADSHGFKFDIIISRNVIEHIYSLASFYAEIYRHNPFAIIFSTTSANFHNPAMRLKHYLLHKKIERERYRPQRAAVIKKLYKDISKDQLNRIVQLTRGMAKEDFANAINNFRTASRIDKVPFLGTNTCDCETGVWMEHLLSKNDLNAIITGAGFRMQYSAGYWDTHYKNPLLNIFARFLNKFIPLMGNKGPLISPFVNIIAYN